MLACDIAADGFIYRLVRSLVGGMTTVARGAAPFASWTQALHGQISEASRQQAPAHGLHLVRIVHRKPPSWAFPSR